MRAEVDAGCKPDDRAVPETKQGAAELRRECTSAPVARVRQPSLVGVQRVALDALAVSHATRGLAYRTVDVDVHMLFDDLVGERVVPTNGTTARTPVAKAMISIIGMAVDTTSNHRYEVEGRTWWFCSAHCRDEFVTQPVDEFVTQPAAFDEVAR